MRLPLGIGADIHYQSGVQRRIGVECFGQRLDETGRGSGPQTEKYRRGHTVGAERDEEVRGGSGCADRQYRA